MDYFKTWPKHIFDTPPKVGEGNLMARTIKFATALETRLAVLIDAKVGSGLLLHD